MFTCIGRRKDGQGKPRECTNTSEVPSNSNRPEWGYLCPLCLGTQYGRAQIHVEIPDMDKPNARELEPFEFENYNHTNIYGQDESEQWDNLEELDLS
jgi:hypothetical protein